MDLSAFETWAREHGISEAYSLSYSPSHLGGSFALRVDVWRTRDRWLHSRCTWNMWPPPPEPEPLLTRGAPLPNGVGERIREAFDKVDFFDAPEPQWAPGLDGGAWDLFALRKGRSRASGVSGLLERKVSAFEWWTFGGAASQLLQARPALFRWPRHVAV